MTDVNPLDTTQQHSLELQAARLLQRPEVLEAKNDAGRHWLEGVGAVRPELRVRFDDALEQIAFHGVLAAVNMDANHPQVHSTPHWAHTVSGVRIPATMGGVPNPDSVYRFIPVDAASSCVITGCFAKARPLVNEFSLVTKELRTLANLSGRDLEVDADGRFAITVDPRPVAGRSNHLQTTEGAVQILIRDTMNHWAAERPSRLHVRRTGGPPAALPLTDDVLAPLAAQSIRKHVTDFSGTNRLAFAQPGNTLKPPAIHRGAASTGGFLVTQAYSMGWFQLHENEALVVTAGTGGAAYLGVALSDFWTITRDCTQHTVSFNTQQAVANADGSYTFVVAVHDPGVHNWLDPDGSPDGVIFARWAGFDPDRLPEANPTIDATVVTLDRLGSVLPAATRMIDQLGRRHQLIARARAYAWRRAIGDSET